MSPDLRASTTPKILVALPLPDISSAFVSILYFSCIFQTFNVCQPAFQCLLVPRIKIKIFQGFSHTGSRKGGVWNTESGFGESSPRNIEQNHETYFLSFRCFIVKYGRPI